MLQPDKLKKLNENALKMSEAGKSKEEILAMKDAFIKQFGTEEPLKKKEVSTSTSTSPNQKLDSVQKVGSSDIQKSQNKTLPVDEFGVTNFNQPKTQPKVETAPIVKKQPLVQSDSLGTTDFGKTPFTPETDLNVENFDKAKSIRKDYSNAIYIPEEKNAEFEQEYNAKINNEGFVNKAKTAVKNWWNNVIDIEPALQVSTDHLVEEKKQAKDELKKELDGKEPTPEQLQKRTKEIFVAKKKGDYQQSLSDSYLESLSDEDRQLVEVKLAKELPTLDKDYVNKTNSFILLGKDIDAIDKELAQMERIVKEQSEMGNNNLDPKFYEEARRLEDLRRNKIIVAKSMDEELYKSKAKLGSALEEYDNFKRSYGDFDVLANRLKSGIADIGYGLASFKNYVNRADRYFGTEIEGITPEVAEIEKSEKEVDFAKKVIDKEQEYFRKRVKEVNGIGDFINYTTDVVGDQIPNMLPFMLTGGLGGGAVIFGSGTGNQYAEMIDGEINQTPFSRIYTDEEKVVAPFVFGVSDTALSAIPTWGRMLRGKRTIQSALKEKGGIDLFAKSSLETAKKGLLRIGKDNASEQLEEQGANLIQNFTRVVYLKEEGATMLDGVEDVFKDTATFSTLLSAFPVAMGGVIKSVSSADQISKFDENAKQIIALKQRLSNSDLSVSQKSIIQSQIDKKTVESKKMISDIQKKFKNKGTEILESVNDVNRSINETLTKAKEIKESNLPKSEKEVILDGLKQDYSAGIDKREKLLSDKSTILDTLSDSEQIKLKDKAQRELRKELEVKGETKIELNDEQITKKAIELYEESKPKAVVEQKPETQPQAEKQSESKKVEIPDWHKQEYDERLEEYDNNISDAKKLLEKEKAKGFFIRSKSWIKFYEDNIKFYEDKAKLLQENPIEFYKSELKGAKEQHEKRLLDKTTYKQGLIDSFGTTDFEVTHSNFIEDTNRKISDYEKVKKTAEKQAEVVEIETKEQKIQRLEAELETITDDNNPRIAEIDTELQALEKKETNAQLEISEKEYNNFIDNGIVTEERLNNIAQKVKNQEKLSEKETAIFNDKTSEINTILKNEATPTNITPTDGNIQPGVGNMAEVGVEEQPTAEVIAEENIQPSNEAGAVEVKNKVEDIDINDIENFLNEMYSKNNQNENNKPTADKGNERAESNSAKQNIGEPKSEEKAKKISLKGRTPIAKRKFKGDRAKANAVEPSDVYSLVLNYFVSGGKIGSASVKELLKSDSEVKARNNGFNGISKKSAKETDALAHDLWQLALSLGIQTDTQLVKEAIEDIVGSHNTNQDITNTILKRNNLELSEEDKIKKLEDFYIAQAVFDQVQEQNDASDEEMQEAQGALDMLSDTEIIELANNQSKSYDDYLKDLEERRVTFNIGPFEEVGTVQSDGSIINDEGEIFSKESVSNVKQVNPKSQKEKVTKVPTGVTGKGTKNVSASAKSLLKEIDKKIEDARQKVRTAKEALDRKAKSLDKEMAKDQENLFGERKSSAEAKLFDERVNAQARNKATESERNAIKTAQDELRKLIQTKKDVESGKITSNQVDLEDVDTEENKRSEYKFSNSPSLKNAQAVDSSILPITPKAAENILKNEGNWDKAIIGDVKNLGNGWFEVGKTVKGESILYSPTTDKAVTIIDSENKGGRNAVYVNDFINNNPTISEKQQRKDKLNAEVDKIAQKVKDFLPGIKDGDNLNAQGFTQDQLIDLIANAVKNLIAAGIDINEAIKQVVESIKDKFGVDVNPDDVKAKLKSERNKNFKKKSGKKSVLGRAVSGGEPLNITEEIEKYGLDYEVESQAKAQENAKEFVKAVGRENALIAVRSGQIKGAEKAFVYAEIIDGIVKEMDSVSIETPDRIALNAQHSTIMGEIMNEFDIESREAGRFISALNRVYFSTYFKYNLSRQINLYKARNGGEISPEKLQEYKETDARLKELERKIEEAEKRAEEAEAKLAMENIVEEVERTSKKQKPDSNAKKAKILAEKIRRGKINRPGIFMSATPASLVWDGAIEVVAKSVEAGGTLSDAIKKGMDYIKKSSWYQSLSDSDKNEAEKSFEDHVRRDARPAMVYIDEDGNIKVPESLIRSLVEQGVKDIDELSQKVLDTIIDEYPDLTLRQVRDAITKYGKTINPDPDTISTEIRKLKRLGKLISGLEDAKSGKRPLKSGLQRDEITQLERKLKRELKDLLRDLPLDDDSVKKTWKTALDAIKSRLRNQIEDLEKQIANKEKSKPEKTPVEYDEEAKALKQKRDELKDTLESIVGKPELSEEKKIIKAIAMLEKSIQNLNEQIADNNIAYKIKPTPVTSARIEELKKQKAELVEQIKQMRIDSGIAEARRLQSAKSRIKNRIAELEKRIKEKNYTTKKPTPLKADQELLDLQAEKIRTQEVYDKDKYIDELKNRTDRQKRIDAVLGLWNIPRVVMATGEASWIFIQGGIQTVNRTLKNPVQMFKIFKKMFKAMASDSKAKEYESLTKARKNYPIMKQAKLALTEVDHKLEAKEEQFLGDYANTVWDFIGVGLRKLSKNKEYRSPFSYFRQLLGKELNSADKATLEQYWKNINPLRILERGNTVYMNELRMARFEEGIEMLQSELKDPIEDIEDYKMLASAINTMTGRANIGSLQANSKILAAIFFSFRNAVSVFNQLNPIFYLYQLHNPKDPITKVSVAQKIAVADMMRFVTFTTGMMLLLQAAMGDDEEGNPKMTIETDPRSSDFGKMKMGDLRIDPWHGMMPMVVLISRMFTDESKNVNTGEVTAGGTKFGTRTRNELAVDFITNKFNPSMGILWRYGSSHKVTENGVEIRKDMFGNEINVLDEVANLQPMYWDAVSEIKKEQPGLWGDFFVAAGALGINSQVYDKPKSKVSSGFNRPRRPSFERPKRP